MRRTMILAASATLIFAHAANAQQQTPVQPPATTPAPAAPEATATAIKTVTVVDIKELPEATQTQVTAIVAQHSEDDLKKLRSSIDATQPAKSALEAKGLTSAQVIAASLTQDGALTLVTRKKT